MLLLPAVLGYLSVAVCPPSKSRWPPAWVFKAVWPVLYLLLGIAFERDCSLLPLVLLLALWAPLRNCLRAPRLAKASVALSLLLAALNAPCHVELVPLALWLAFALTL